tara:strand:- start:58 stop:447 length:390 start_codon:yes stop_codon:yes gene_type:complete
MTRSIVTSENKAEHDDARLSPSVKRAYATDSKAAEAASKEAKDHKTHSYASWAHRHASIYAHPPENVEKHLSEAKRHAAEARKIKRLEEERYVKEREENARKANIRSNKAMGITASSDEEKRTGKYSTY